MTAPTPAPRALIGGIGGMPRTGKSTLGSVLQVALSTALQPQLDRVFEALDEVASQAGVLPVELLPDLERLGWTDIADAYDARCEDHG